MLRRANSDTRIASRLTPREKTPGASRIEPTVRSKGGWQRRALAFPHSGKAPPTL